MASRLYTLLAKTLHFAFVYAILEVRDKEKIFQITVNSKNLEAVLLKSMVTSSQLQCLHRCKLHHGCEDINYNLITKECEFLGQKSENKRKESYNKDDWTFVYHFTETPCKFPTANLANKGICPSWYQSETRALAANTLLTTFQIWPPSWKVSLEIKPYGILAEHSNILHITCGGNVDKYGDRNPAVFFLPGTSRLHITSAVSSNMNLIFDTPLALPLHVYSTLELAQLYEQSGRYRYTIKVNGNLLYSVINYQARQFNNVKMYSGDPWYGKAPAFVRNLLVMNYV